jgi:predicted ester cyclase
MNIDTENKKLVMDFHRRIGERDVAGACALVAEDLVNHSAIPEAQGRAGLASIFDKLHTAFPDVRWLVQDVFGEGDRVFVRIRTTGTHTGPLAMTRMPLAATGKAIDFEQLHVFRIAGGKVVESWGARDDLAMLRQLGLAPRPV